MTDISVEAIQVLDPTGDPLLIPSALPVLPVRNLVVFPGVTVPLNIGRPKSIAAIEESETDGYLLVVPQKEANIEEPNSDDLFEYGTIVRVLRSIDSGKEGRQSLVAGIARAAIGEILSEEPTLRVRFHPLHPREETDEDRITWHRVVELAQRVIELRDDYPNDWKAFISEIPTGGMLADLLASNLTMSMQDATELLAEADTGRRLVKIEEHLEREITIAQAQRDLRSQTQDLDVDKKQRERMLRARMREIQDEIGETDAGMREVDELQERLDAANLPEEAHALATQELKRLSALPQQAPDRPLIRTYLEAMADLPWDIETEDNLDIAQARNVLNADHHGLENVKERILEFLSVRKLAPEARAPILCFVGPPGVGKTSLGKSIARCMGRKFARASLGGVRDEAEIRGHRRTYVGAMPGRILQSIKRAGSKNPIFLLDEIDKLGSGFQGDPSSALLEVLDPEQNRHFSDHYIECEFDLSKVLFISTANSLATIPPALLDRMEVIELTGYTGSEKLEIARKHLLPRQLEAHGLSTDQFKLVGDTALQNVINDYTREAGVRNLERFIATLMRKAARTIAEKGRDHVVEIDEPFVSKSLGAPPHLPEVAERTSIPGIAIGLAVTPHGGDILFIEATRMTGGKGLRLRLTGQIGKVMKESAEAALSWVRSNAAALGLPDDALSPGEIHLHVPAGAVPKDGPSAGIALVTAIVSVLSQRKAASLLATTGEITLRGRILPVGGIKSKLFAASRAGIDSVVMPRRNEKDLVDVPEEVKDQLDIRLVDTIQDALGITLPNGPIPRG